MKNLFKVIIAIMLVATFAFFAVASGEDEDASSKTQSKGNAATEEIGEYELEIASSRLASSYDGKKVIIVKYIFKNNSDEPSAFYLTFEDHAYQNGVGLNEAYILDDSANYEADNQTKEIKSGASIEVEVAYELNDETTEVEIEVEELFSFDDTVIKKTFSIA